MKSRKLIISLFFILIFGLALYLPFLGVKEFQGEEGRRVLIALQMLEKGEYLLPTLFDEPYFNKPPLFNWALAGLFTLTSNYSEFTARALSSFTLILTALILTYFWYALLRVIPFKVDYLNLLLPGLIFLTTPEVIDKALRAEIDAFYTSLITIAVFSWFYFSEIKVQRIRAYLFSGAFLGLSILAKTFQALIFFYLALIPYLIWQRRTRELFSIPHLLGICTILGVFFTWAIPVSLKVGFTPFIKAWILEYFSAAQGQAMSFWQHLEAYTLSALLGFSPWIFLLFSFKSKSLKDFLKDNPLYQKLFYYSLFLFGLSYLFHLLFPGARLRYMLPSVGGLAYTSAIVLLYYFIHQQEISMKIKLIFKGLFLISILLAFGSLIYLNYINISPSPFFYLFLISFFFLNMYYLLKRFYTIKDFFILMVFYVFLAKQLYVTIYYPYHQANMNYFRRAAFEIAEKMKYNNSFYLCKSMPHHLIYYLKYRYNFVNKITYLKDCNQLPNKAYVLIYEKDIRKDVLNKYKHFSILIRNKKYYLIESE